MRLNRTVPPLPHCTGCSMGGCSRVADRRQENAVIDAIGDYFHHDIPEVPYNDEDRFIAVLKEAGLTEG